ncbi:LPS export ABC transporter periplasmic protein LptC [Breoghania corrubedonensis]|nr:LPS export ABC transporter periplasmic protein LptC [Breoghania corrubedonensis]
MDQRTDQIGPHSSAGVADGSSSALWGVQTPERLQHERRAARRHSTRVRWLKRLLPAMSVLIVAGVLGAMALRNLLPGFDLGAINITTDGIVMSNPELSGHDGERSYRVTAKRAIQSLMNPKLITLEEIDARVKLSPEEWVAFTAPHGIYDSGNERLKLSDGIKLEWSRGYHVTLSGAEIGLKDGSILSDDAIHVSSDQGTFQAGRISVADNGASVHFTDGIKMTLHPAQAGDKKQREQAQ